MKYEYHCESPVEQQLYLTVLILASNQTSALAMVSPTTGSKCSFYVFGKLLGTEQGTATENQALKPSVVHMLAVVFWFHIIHPLQIIES